MIRGNRFAPGCHPLHSVRDHLVGVIDLKSGSAVHAVAGDRANYQPVGNARGRDVNGDPAALAKFYLSLGVTSLYVADLDGITSGQTQWECLSGLLDECAEQFDEVLLDVGCNLSVFSNWLGHCVSLRPNVRAIVATECADSVDCLQELADHVDADHLCVGFDFRDGHFVSRSGSQSDWLLKSLETGIRQFVLLDVSSVGTGNMERSIELTRRFRSFANQHSIRVFGGGGVKSAADVRKLRENGCDHVLVATALQAGT